VPFCASFLLDRFGADLKDMGKRSRLRESDKEE
jgi:hypothetical protein